MQSKDHWDNVYRTKEAHQVSWTQEEPTTSLQYILSLSPDRQGPIIDIGGGDGHLAECLLREGYTDITILDISGTALDRAKARLGDKAANVKFIQSDILQFSPDRKYHFWHDRATFHFLTEQAEASRYAQIAASYTLGHMAIGTFATEGPERCSGLNVTRHDEASLTAAFPDFERLKCVRETHITPFATAQEFVFCAYRPRQRAS